MGLIMKGPPSERVPPFFLRRVVFFGVVYLMCVFFWEGRDSLGYVGSFQIIDQKDVGSVVKTGGIYYPCTMGKELATLASVHQRVSRLQWARKGNSSMHVIG